MTAVGGLAESFVDAAGYRTHYWEAGSGEPLLLLLHSADPGSGGYLEYRHNIGPLSTHFRVIAPDIIGFGKTDPPDSLLTHPAYVEHILAFMDALDLQRVHLVGNSRGGLIAISIAGEHPERVGRLILTGASGGGLPPEIVQTALDPFASYRPGRENLRKVLARSFYDLDRSIPPDVLDQYLEASTRQYTAYARVGGYPMDVPDLRPLLANIQVPVLFFFGKEDRVFPIQGALEAHLNTPGSRLYALSNCGHHPQTEYPDDFNVLATEFLLGRLGEPVSQ